MEHGKPEVEDCFFGSVTVGDRGQIVIPAEARHALGLQAGDKLLVFRDPVIEGVTLARLEAVQSVLDHLSGYLAKAKIDGADGGPQ